MSADKEEIRARNDIVEVIGGYVPLKKRGKTYLGLCPFHQEKTPSFNVDPVYQSFKCFGCDASGDIFTFVERFENMSFLEAAEFLARRVGLTFERKGTAGEPGKASERDQLYEVNATALKWFQQRLEQVPVARDYLYKQRGLVHETIQRFQLGYAPEGWDGLTGYLQSRRMSLPLAATAGLLRVREDGGYYDVFRHRILFPILDEQERVVGFGGRAFGDEQPKYLNTGETPIFTKSRLLYGLPLARKKIAAEGKVLLMEGYMDVIAAHQAGFTNAIATLGTSLTDEHAKKLARLLPDNPTVVLVYDADAAGIKATLRASETLEKENVQVRVVRLPQGDDPDSLLKRGDSARFQLAIDNAPDRVEYLLEYAKSRRDMLTEDGRLGFLSDAYRILAEVESMTVRDHHLSNLAQFHPMAKYGIPIAVSEMRKELEERRRRLRAPKPRVAVEGEAPPTRQGAQGPSGTQGTQGAPGSGFQRTWRPRGWPPETASEKLKRTGDNVGGQAAPVATLTAEERAEAELMVALSEPEWRATVLNYVGAEDLFTPLGRRFYDFVIEYRVPLDAEDSETGPLVSLLNRNLDAETSAAILAELQEFRARLANVPITEEAIQRCAALLWRRRLKEYQAELAQFVQEKQLLTDEDSQRVRDLHAILKLLQKPALSVEDRGGLEHARRLFRELHGLAGSH